MKKPSTLRTSRDGVVYDRDTGDFAAYLAGRLLGFAATFAEAEALLDSARHQIAA